MLRLILTTLALFATLGLFIARLFYSELGIEPGFLYLGLGALAITALLISRSVVLIVLTGSIAVGVGLPEPLLTEYGLDQDVLLYLLLALLCLPLVQRHLSSR